MMLAKFIFHLLYYVLLRLFGYTMGLKNCHYFVMMNCVKCFIMIHNCMEDASINLLKVSTVYMNYCCAPCPESILTVTCLNFRMHSVQSVSSCVHACLTCILCIINSNLKLEVHEHTLHYFGFQCAISHAVSYSSCAQKVVT